MVSQRRDIQQKIKLYDTATRSVRPFEPISPDQVRIYSCGMTVYYLAHVGHLRAYSTSDLLRRLFEYAGYPVRHVMNVTDVGHMTSDEDAGEDKLELGARREGKSPWELARFYEDHFFRTISRVEILRPQVICRATEHIQAQIELIRRLEERGYTYRTQVGIIFDTGKFPSYGDFARLDLEGQNAGARVMVDEERRNPQDFALWVVNQPKHIMQWESPWGRGFPGWHLECSAMAMRYLGEQIDVHTGGIDHIPIHHTNEIAQSEAATGKQFSRFWVHTAFLNVDSQKMSKSLGNLFTVDDVVRRGFHPLALRYLFFGSSYRKPLNFTWEALDGAQRALLKVWECCAEYPAPEGEPLEPYLSSFEEAICNDLNMPQALAALWELLNSKQPPARKAATVLAMDSVLGLDIANSTTCLHDSWHFQGFTAEKLVAAQQLADQRQQFRKQKNYAESDRVRKQIEELGYRLEDRRDCCKVFPEPHFDLT